MSSVRHGQSDKNPPPGGRYLNDRLANRLRYDEPGALARLGSGRCRIVPIYNGLRSAPRGAAAGLRGGQDAAQETLRLAREHGIPVNVRLYMDLKGWQVRPDWLVGWWATMAASEYVGMGGLYGRGAGVRVAPGSYRPRDARERIRSSGWAGRVPDAEDCYLQQHWPEFEFPDDTGLPGTMPHSDRTSCYIWSNTPRRVGELPPGAPVIPTEFTPAGPVGSTITETVLWQYRFNCFRDARSARGFVDLDLATERAYREMWQVGS